ncbi:thioesterase II family protein [Streptomyces sp. NBC_00557]|uniref:thioesterase II family protein n=1 Tax=Streptomyces sp. NBC_00557 TaxID=2975776 RepID=UPI002E81133F|nr:alpha/beta fold hydrolase [Streptomyces sp. NBC_00557]WUC40371.1 alpha/beta fold hydrolase [Streptomyces sp. NBC_00557]
MSEARLVRFGPERPTAPVVVCFPHAGGGASAFRRWARVLPGGLELMAVQLPGREDRAGEPFLTDFDALVAATARPVEEAVAGRPYAFFGHSAGSLIAFALARRARRLERALPAALAVSSFPPPHTLRPHALDDVPDKAILDFLNGLSYAFSNGPGAQPDLIREILPVLRADFAAVSSYRHSEEAPLECPLHVFGGSVDRFVRPAELERWRDYTQHEFSLRIMRGGHFHLHQNAAGILDVLAAHLIQHPITQEA